METYTRDQMAQLIIAKLQRNFGRTVEQAHPIHMFKACALVIRDLMASNDMVTTQLVRAERKRQVHYLSMEFLMGRSLEKNAYNLGILEPLEEAVEFLGFKLSDLFEAEPDAGLGNGGLGRLAACYLDSLTTLEIPATGYSICYELGIFKQKIVDGQQIELADNWIDVGGAWLITKEDEAVEVRFGGHVEDNWDDEGRNHPELKNYTSVLAIPRDMVIAGYKTDHTNTLRLWDAKSPTPVDMNYYSSGDYLKAVERQAMAEVIAKVLYPADNHYEGRLLRLRQQYFFVSATVQSIVRKHRQVYGTMDNFHEKHILQINDTHPTLVIPELMRILLDEDGYDWDDAWNIVTRSVAYTNHTVLSEALERWPQRLFEQLLPRIWDILREIARRYQLQLEEQFPNDGGAVYRMAIIWDDEVRMANLCVCACCAVNGVSALHTEILREDVFADAAKLQPKKFKNVTNGIDHRRWLSQVNPGLDNLIRECTGGDDYLLQPEKLRELEKFKDDAGVLKALGDIKRENKLAFAEYAKRDYGIILNTDAIFDVQVKRLHEYKRQLLNVLHIIYLYLHMKEDKNFTFTPRTYLFGAKAAPGYYVAKRIIRLINSVANTINNDPVCKDRLQVFFLENYRVSLAEKLMPASELSEQISTAGKEASGTGNMKFMMNGALTIGTMDGANVEMFEQVGGDNIFIFGLTSQEITELWHRGYHAYDYFMSNPDLRWIIKQMNDGFNDGETYEDLSRRLISGDSGAADEYMLFADFESYKDAQYHAGKVYGDPKMWNRMSLVNIARSGIFAADRSVCDYAETIWNVPHR